MSGKKRFSSFMSSDPEPAEPPAAEPELLKPSRAELAEYFEPPPPPPHPAPPPVTVTVNVPFVPALLQNVVDAAVASIANPYPVTRRALNEAIKAARAAGLIV